MQCLWSPRVLDWDRKLRNKPNLWLPRSQRSQLEAQQYRPVDGEIDPIIDLGGNAVTNAMRRSTMHLIQPVAAQNNTLIAGDGAEQAPGPGVGNSDLKPVLLDPAMRGSSPAVSLSGGTTGKSGTPVPGGTESLPTNAIDHLVESSKLPLDVAVLESICQSGTEDKVKRVATNILIVGGIGNAQGVGFALQSRLVTSRKLS